MVAREQDDDTPRGWRGVLADLGWLSGSISSGDGLTVAYAGRASEAAEAADQAIREGYGDVLVVPVTGDPEGERQWATGVDALQPLLIDVADRHPSGTIALAGVPPYETPTFDQILSLIHPADADSGDLLAEAIERAFAGDTERFGRFMATLQRGMPEGTQLAIRGSAVQGYAYKSEEPFDARGPGTSDLDIVLFGDAAMAAFHPEAFAMPGVNTLPLADESGWVAPTLDPPRRAAQAIAGRPVSLQAMARWFLDLRSGLQGTPYVLLDA